MYTLEELNSMLGQKVRKSQFKDTFDIHIIITDVHKTADNDTEGILSFAGTELNSKSDKLFTMGASICPIYNDSMELDEQVYVIG